MFFEEPMIDVVVFENMTDIAGVYGLSIPELPGAGDGNGPVII